MVGKATNIRDVGESEKYWKKQKILVDIVHEKIQLRVKLLDIKTHSHLKALHVATNVPKPTDIIASS